MNKSQAMWAVVAALTIWCITNTSKVNSIIEDTKHSLQMDSHLLDRMIHLEQDCCKEEVQEEIVPDVIHEVQGDDPVSFNEVFSEMRDLYGPDNTFVWNGREYTTNYYEETLN